MAEIKRFIKVQQRIAIYNTCKLNVLSLSTLLLEKLTFNDVESTHKRELLCIVPLSGFLE